MQDILKESNPLKFLHTSMIIVFNLTQMCKPYQRKSKKVEQTGTEKDKSQLLLPTLYS